MVGGGGVRRPRGCPKLLYPQRACFLYTKLLGLLINDFLISYDLIHNSPSPLVN